MSASMEKERKSTDKLRKVIRLLASGLFAAVVVIFVVSLFASGKGEIHLLGYHWNQSDSIIRILQAASGMILAQTCFFAERLFPVRIPLLFEILFDVFLFMALFLGSIFGFYSIFIHFNTITHFYFSVITAIFSYGLLESDRNNQAKHSHQPVNPGIGKAFGSLFALGMASLTSLVWEWWEFTVDTILPRQNSQRYMTEDGVPLPGRAALFDSMTDMGAHLLGGLTGVILVFLFDRGSNERNFDWQLKPQVLEKK